MFRGIEANPFDITYHPDREVIVLRDEDGNSGEYKDDEETERMRSVVKRYNEFMSSFFIDIPTLEESGIPVAKNGGVNWFAVNQGPNFTHRVFNRSSLTKGGRFYGGWWQNCPKEYRERIFINDKPTSEIDYSNNHIVLLYAQEGMEWPGGDAYDIEQPPELLHIKDYRGLVKSLLLMAINAENAEKTFLAFRSDASAGTPEKRLTNDQLSLVLDLLKKKHSPISHKLASGAGIELQRIDSDITERIITRFMDYELPILIIHDSFVVQDGQESFLREAMTWAFQEVTGKQFVPVEEKTHHPEAYLPDNWEDWGVNIETVEQAIRYRHDPVRSERYIELRGLFQGRARDVELAQADAVCTDKNDRR